MSPNRRGDQRSWPLRTLPRDLVDRYQRHGWWTDATLGSTIAEGLDRKRGTEFVVHSSMRPWRGSLGELDRAARSFASSLSQWGVGPGDVVVLQLPNWVEAAITFWGAGLLGAVVVPVVHFYGPKELAYIIDSTKPEVVVTTERFGRLEYLEATEEILADHDDARWLVVGGTESERALPRRADRFVDALDSPPLREPIPVDPASPAIIAFTSGTTSDPKGVVHSHRTMCFETEHLSWMTPPQLPPMLTAAPVGHFMGMLSSLLAGLSRPQPVHLIDTWDPSQVLSLMLAEGIAVSGGSSYFLTSLLDHAEFTDDHLPFMPYAGLGGAPVPIALAERATALGIEVCRSYGSTEQPSITGANLEVAQLKRMTTDGHPLLGVELRVDEEGQILSRGPDLFIGYTDPDLTEATVDPDGWYRTGDVGTLDEDGFLTITDRIADVIIRGGENISAQEVEDALLRLSTIAEVYVVAKPDDRFGERAAAILRMHGGHPLPTVEELQEHLGRMGLAKQKWPEAVHAVDDFPRTSTGKVQKYKLRTLLREGRL